MASFGTWWQGSLAEAGTGDLAGVGVACVSEEATALDIRKVLLWPHGTESMSLLLHFVHWVSGTSISWTTLWASGPGVPLGKAEGSQPSPLLAYVFICSLLQQIPSEHLLEARF